ncbi:hypothetical protein GQR58_002772 [Nymphon striatum]|nr:hypothetical protein GQR58_002772 [Nymphon striatum]
MDSNLHATQLCVSAGPPDPVENCSIINETRSRVHVECDAGHDGGMPQIFYAEVYLHPQHILQSNISAFNQPIFISSNLKPNTHYMFVIYAANSKDRSQTVAIIANTKAGVSNKNDHCLQVKFSCTFLFIPIHTGKFKCRYINIPAPRFCDTSLIFQEEKKKLKYRCVEISEDEIDLSSCEDYCEEIGGWGKCVEPYKFQPLKSVSEDRYTSVSNSPF